MANSKGKIDKSAKKVQKNKCDIKDAAIKCSKRTKISKDVHRIIGTIPCIQIDVVDIEKTDRSHYFIRLGATQSDLVGYHSAFGEVIARFKAIFEIKFVMICIDENQAYAAFTVVYK